MRNNILNTKLVKLTRDLEEDILERGNGTVEALQKKLAAYVKNLTA